jgi:hypothetical protein
LNIWPLSNRIVREEIVLQAARLQTTDLRLKSENGYEYEETKAIERQKK